MGSLVRPLRDLEVVGVCLGWKLGDQVACRGRHLEGKDKMLNVLFCHHEW